ncbi:MAG: O-antigen ligase family protein [Clostridiales bacterium]|nr:O-antigen ligase family protein [Clostridiales bacterium]
MKSLVTKARTRYRANPAWCWLLATVFLFPILPEYISPFVLFAGFIVFKRQWSREGRLAKVGSLGKLEMVFMAFALLSTLWSDTKLETVAMALLWWGMFLIQVMIFNLANTKQKINAVLKTIVAGAAVNSAVAAVQIITYLLYKYNVISQSLVLSNPFYRAIDKAVYTWLPFKIRTNTFDDRASGFFSNPNLLATYLLLAFPISIYLFLNAKTKKSKCVYLFTNLLISGGISSTLSRSACLIVLIGWLFMFIVLIRRHGKELFGIGVSTCLIVVPSLLTRYGLILNPDSGSSDAPQSTSAHLKIWGSAFDYIIHHISTFIYGLGFGCESTGAYLLASYQLDKPHAHNFILEFWSELGIIGVALFVAVIACAVGKIFEINANNGKKFDLIFCIFASLVLLLLFGMTDFIFNSPKQIILFMMSMGIIQAISQCYDKTLIKSTGDFIKATSHDLKQMVELEK